MALTERQIKAVMKNEDITKQLLKEAVKALTGIVRHPQFGDNIPLREVRIHMLDEDSDGIGMWIEWNPETEEFEKGMISIAADALEDESEGEEDSWEENRAPGPNELLN